jgi:hypothetical protein
VLIYEQATAIRAKKLTDAIKSLRNQPATVQSAKSRQTGQIKDCVMIIIGLRTGRRVFGKALGHFFERAGIRGKILSTFRCSCCIEEM